MAEPYKLHQDFERAVLYFCGSSKNFWARVGYALDPEALDIPECRVLWRATAYVAHVHGSGPGNTLLVVQRLRQLVDEGKMTWEDFERTAGIYDQAEDRQLPEEEAVIDLLAPIVKRRLQSQAVVAAHDEFAKRGDFESVRKYLGQAEQIGSFERATGVQIGKSSFEVIGSLQGLARMPLGIMELDIALQDGPPRGTLNVWLGDSGAGKSIALASMAAEAMRNRVFVGLVTLELPKHVQLARIIANLTDIDTDTILEVPDIRRQAEERLEGLLPTLGACVVAEFAPDVTSVADLKQWVEEEEQRAGAKMDALVVDYADKLYDPRVKNDNTYQEMRHVYEGLRRDIAVARNMWVYSASQASRPNRDSQKRLDLGHVADSMHKVRVADLVISLNVRGDDGDQIEFYVAKNRLGRSRFSVGPLPHDWAKGRIVA